MKAFFTLAIQELMVTALFVAVLLVFKMLIPGDWAHYAWAAILIYFIFAIFEAMKRAADQYAHSQEAGPDNP